MADIPNPSTPIPKTGSIDRALSSAVRLNRALEGNLPCIICGYDLKGVTIRGSCPECGTLVRATILYTVDPEAEEFRPMLTPRLTAWSIALWPVFGLLAAVAGWWVRIADGVRRMFGFFVDASIAQWVCVGSAAASGLALVGMLRPTAKAPWKCTLWALLAMAAYGPLVVLLMMLNTWDRAHASPYFAWTPTTATADLSHREWIRLGIGVCLATIFLAIRPNARELVRRSLAMRTGRVDRQTLLALAGAVTVAACGDVLRLLSPHLPDTAAAVLGNLGTVMVAVGSLFMTLGIASLIIDSWRIRSVILLPAPSLHEVLGPDPATPAQQAPSRPDPPSTIHPPPT